MVDVWCHNQPQHSKTVNHKNVLKICINIQVLIKSIFIQVNSIFTIIFSQIIQIVELGKYFRNSIFLFILFQTVLLADILPTLIIKITAPFYMQRIPYR